jgi:hypothetical protein
VTIPQAWIDDLGTDDDRLCFLEYIDPEWTDHFPSDMPELALDHYMTYTDPKWFLKKRKQWEKDYK